MKVSVVIGANYGDEGKGRVVDWLAHRDALVIRFNGGAQAGHTVIAPDGYRHVFHHFGSGTFARAPTFLSRFFILNPILFRQEQAELSPYWPKVYVDPYAPVTTPYDMLLNQDIEKMRNTKRHGSCGVGINETVVRNREPEFQIRAWNLANQDELKRSLKLIREVYVPARAEALGIKMNDVYKSEPLLKRFLEDCRKMCLTVTETSLTEAIKDARVEHLIFEGAQGLRLDEDAPGFPHVTRSKTGLTNVRKILDEWKVRSQQGETPEVYYVTRPYLTRHGAGPLNGELSEKPSPLIEDKTNIPHEFQGSLRFAFLNLEDFSNTVNQDQKGLKIRTNLFISCTDHVQGEWSWWDGGELRHGYWEEMAEKMADDIGANAVLYSVGPTEEDTKSLGV